MGKRHQFWAVASLLVGRYGRGGAPAQAEANARRAAQDGDGDAHAIWSDVAGALQRRRDTTRPARGGQAD